VRISEKWRNSKAAAAMKSACARSHRPSGCGSRACPNTVGMVNAEIGMLGSFVNFPRWERGHVSIYPDRNFHASSDAPRHERTDPAPAGRQEHRCRHKVEVDELEFLNYVAEDPGTKMIGPYIESIRHPRAFFDKAREVRRTRPIVVLTQAVQDDIAEQLLRQVKRVQQLRVEVLKGLESFDRGRYTELDAQEIIKQARATYMADR